MIIPNSAITNEVVFNHTDSTIACRLDIRVSYASDLLLAKQIIRQEAQTVTAIDHDTIDVILSKTGVTFSLVFRLDSSPVACSSSLREAIVLLLLSEHIALT